MNFSDFLKQRKDQLGFKTTNEHYAYLGGSKTLEVTLRHFRGIESGQHPPSPKIFNVVFSKTPVVLRRTLVQAYFKTIIPVDENTEVHQFLEQALISPLKQSAKSLWELPIGQMEYSWEQLNYLTKNVDALLLHKRVLLYDKVNVDESNVSKEILAELKRLKLIEVNKNTITPSSNLYRLPIQEKSSHRLMTMKNNYILKNIDIFLKREGCPEQHFDLDVLIVSQETGSEILRYQKTIKEWIRSLAISNHSKPNKPIIFSSFARILDEHDF